MSGKKYKVAIIGMDHCHANMLFGYFQKNRLAGAILSKYRLLFCAARTIIDSG